MHLLDWGRFVADQHSGNPVPSYRDRGVHPAPEDSAQLAWSAIALLSNLTLNQGVRGGRRLDSAGGSGGLLAPLPAASCTKPIAIAARPPGSLPAALPGEQTFRLNPSPAQLVRLREWPGT